MKGYDNQGRLASEINTCYVDGKTIVTTTSYDPNSGNANYQNISVWDSKTGRGTTQHVIRGKLLP